MGGLGGEGWLGSVVLVGLDAFGGVRVDWVGQSRWVRFGGLGWFGLGGWVRFWFGFLSWVGWLCSIVFDLLAVQFIPMYSVCVK